MSNLPIGPLTDDTLRLLREGYAFVPNRRTGAGRDVVPLRLLGRRAVAACGPLHAEEFYDEDLFGRAPAMPEPVRSTLFGHDAVQGLDGAAHRDRRKLFLAVLDPDSIEFQTAVTLQAWNEAVDRWRHRDRVTLFDEAANVLLRGSWAATGLDAAGDPDTNQTAADMVAMVDGFATAGPRHWRGRLARRRQERRLTEVVERVRSGAVQAPPGSALDTAARHRDEQRGDVLPARIAAVELLNIVRPTVAVAWFVTFAAHALYRWPEQGGHLAGDEESVTAFVHEVRRFYPFAPFVGAVARKDLEWDGVRIQRGNLVLLDLFGQNHHPDLWADPYRFDADRFVHRTVGTFELVPQGAGDPATSHRCPGEDLTVTLLRALLPQLGRLDYRVPEQDMSISLGRIPAKPHDGFVIDQVQPKRLSRLEEKR